MKKSESKTIRCKADCIEIFYDNLDHRVRVLYEENGLETIQLYGNKLNGQSYQTRKSMLFNQLQNKMYRRLIFGLESLNKAELKVISKADLRKLQQDHIRTQKVLNQWKNQIVSSYLDKMFTEIFWNSSIAKEMVEFSKDPESIHEENNMSFKELGISKKQIAGKLIEHGLLPVNFFHLQAS